MILARVRARMCNSDSEGAPEWAILLLRACARMRDSDGGRALEWAIDSRTTRINDSDLIFLELGLAMRN